MKKFIFAQPIQSAYVSDFHANCSARAIYTVLYSTISLTSFPFCPHNTFLDQFYCCSMISLVSVSMMVGDGLFVTRGLLLFLIQVCMKNSRSFGIFFNKILIKAAGMKVLWSGVRVLCFMFVCGLLFGGRVLRWILCLCKGS